MKERKGYSPKEQARVKLFTQNKIKLREFARRALDKGKTNLDVILVCIDVDDPAWSSLVDILMPNYDWDQFRKQGKKPVACGYQPTAFIKILEHEVPDISSALHMTPPKDEYRVVVMTCSSAALFYIKPRRLGLHNR